MSARQKLRVESMKTCGCGPALEDVSGFDSGEKNQAVVAYKSRTYNPPANSSIHHEAVSNSSFSH